MNVRKVSPRYFSDAGIFDAEDLDSFDPVELFLKFNEWHEIPTKETDEGYGIDGGVLHDLIIVPGENIQADLLYDDEIECVDFVDRSSTGDHLSYPPQNPLFHSENLEVVKDGHYRFTTNYMSPAQVVAFFEFGGNFTKKERNDEVVSHFLGRVHSDDPLDLLSRIFKKIRASNSGRPRADGYYDFDELFEEYKEIGKISGDCKAVSTFTAGIIESLGLKARIVSGSIHSETLEQVVIGRQTYDSYQQQHQWAEVFIPQDNERGYWLLVDPAFGVFFFYTHEQYRYSLSWINLPSFKNHSKETARLRLQYV